MKFKDKYPSVKSGDKIDNHEDTLIVGEDRRPCLICKEPTEFVDFCSEGRFCSDECQRSFYDRLAQDQDYDEPNV